MVRTRTVANEGAENDPAPPNNAPKVADFTKTQAFKRAVARAVDAAIPKALESAMPQVMDAAIPRLTAQMQQRGEPADQEVQEVVPEAAQEAPGTEKRAKKANRESIEEVVAKQLKRLAQAQGENESEVDFPLLKRFCSNDESESHDYTPSLRLGEEAYILHLDAEVSEKQRKLITEHKYIDFNSLIKPIDKPKGKRKLDIQSGPEGYYFQETDDDTKDSVDFDLWESQFLVYATVLSRAQPSQAVGLFHYLAHIKNLSKSNDTDWYKYDQKFRRMHESNPKLYAFEVDVWKIQNLCRIDKNSRLTKPNKFDRKPATTTSSSHYNRNAPYKPTSDQSFPKDTCWKFQRGEYCPGCNWKGGHKCCWCQGGHPGSRCSTFNFSPEPEQSRQPGRATASSASATSNRATPGRATASASASQPTSANTNTRT